MKLNFKPATKKEANSFSDEDAGNFFRAIACVSSSPHADMVISDFSDSLPPALAAPTRSGAGAKKYMEDIDSKGEHRHRQEARQRRRDGGARRLGQGWAQLAAWATST